MTRNELIHITLWRLKYPTTSYWLNIASSLCYNYTTVEQLVSRLKNLDLEPTLSGGNPAIAVKGATE